MTMMAISMSTFLWVRWVGVEADGRWVLKRLWAEKVLRLTSGRMGCGRRAAQVVANMRRSAERTTTERPGQGVADGVEGRRVGGDAERRGQGDEVRTSQLGGRGLPEGAGHELAQDAVAAVVDDQPGDVGVVLSSGGELGDPVHRAPVAGDREGAPTGADGRGECSGEGEAQPAGALGGVELAVLGVPCRPGPVAGDGHVPERVHVAGHGAAKVGQEATFAAPCPATCTRSGT